MLELNLVVKRGFHRISTLEEVRMTLQLLPKHALAFNNLMEPRPSRQINILVAKRKRNVFLRVHQLMAS
jgi:hypothetical protein